MINNWSWDISSWKKITKIDGGNTVATKCEKLTQINKICCLGPLSPNWCQRLRSNRALSSTKLFLRLLPLGALLPHKGNLRRPTNVVGPPPVCRRPLSKFGRPKFVFITIRNGSTTTRCRWGASEVICFHYRFSSAEMRWYCCADFPHHTYLTCRRLFRQKCRIWLMAFVM